MSALAREVIPARDIEELLYQWGDESRSTAEQLGLPPTSSIARMIAQQRVFEQQRKGVRRKRPKQTNSPITLRDGRLARICICGRVYLAGDCVIGEESVCPRCRNDPRRSENIAHGTQTRSLRHKTMQTMSASTASIEAIVSEAPGWMQECLRLSYVFRLRDSRAAQRLRIRTSSYREQREAAVEYVAQRLAERGTAAL